MPEKFNEIFSLIQELQFLQYVILYFKITPKKWTVTFMFNVQTKSFAYCFNKFSEVSTMTRPSLHLLGLHSGRRRTYVAIRNFFGNRCFLN